MTSLHLFRLHPETSAKRVLKEARRNNKKPKGRVEMKRLKNVWTGHGLRTYIRSSWKYSTGQKCVVKPVNSIYRSAHEWQIQQLWLKGGGAPAFPTLAIETIGLGLGLGIGLGLGLGLGIAGVGIAGVGIAVCTRLKDTLMMMMMMNFNVLVMHSICRYLPVFVAHCWNCRLSYRLRSARHPSIFIFINIKWCLHKPTVFTTWFGEQYALGRISVIKLTK